MTSLIDTNLLVYRIDPNDPAKRQRSSEVITALIERGSGALSAQGLAEYANVAVKRFKLSPERVSTHVVAYQRLLPVHALTAGVVLEALRGLKAYGFSYYDAQVWAVAKLYQLEAVLSEDFNAGATLEGVRFVNPFEPDFEVTSL